MNIRFLETFIWLARLQNFRLTAEHLHTTQAAVSSRIAALEDSFDVRLFERSSRSAKLTPAGRRMLAYAERIVRLNAEMRRDVAGTEGAGGLVRLGVIESIVHSWFPVFMARLRECYPRVDIEVTSDTTLRLARLLHTDDVDVILQASRIPGQEFVNLSLGEFPLRWVASPSLELAGTTLDLACLAQFPIVSFARNSSPHASLEQLFACTVDRPARINCITSIAAMVRLVADGFGVAALPVATIQRELREGTLELLDVRVELPSLPLVVSYRAQSHPLAASVAEIASQAMADFSTAPERAPGNPESGSRRRTRR